MKILMVNKFFYHKGGSETYFFALRQRLQAEGHTIVDFSMQDEQNEPSPYSDFFVDNVSYEEAGGIAGKAKMAAQIIYSTEAKRKFEALIRQEKPDLIHLHVFQHQLSPSILAVGKKYNIPMVYTAHDLKMVCLNYKMMHHGRICEDCRDGKLLHCAKNRCVKGSLAKSCINVAEGTLHRFLKSYDVISAIITPSAFYREKFQQFGVVPERLVHIPNFLDGEAPHFHKRLDEGRYYLYLGRLVEEKGVETLLRAVEGTDLPLMVAGTGPLEASLREYAASHGMDNVKMLGFQSGQALTDLVANARAVILPSEWYENGPYSAIEALQLGRPLVGADIGGIPELIDGNGLLFPSGDAVGLRQKLLQMEALSPEEYHRMEERSYQLFAQRYTWHAHWQQLEAVYRRVCAEKTH